MKNLRTKRKKSSQKMWVSLLATVGLSTAIFFLKQYSNGNAKQIVNGLLGSEGQEKPQMN